MTVAGNGSDRLARLAAILILAGVSACAVRSVKTTAPDPSAIEITQLWQEPLDLETRDLFLGAGREVPPPNQSTPLEYVATDTSGYSPGYDVRDANGVMWDVKLGPEAQTEVVASRLLWAAGYHQVPTYYVADWTMSGGPEPRPGPGRFRPDLAGWKEAGEWSWYENDFVTTQPFKGLVVINLMMNNWDWKTSNNKIYDVTQSDGPPERWYVVRDLGASFGRTNFPKLLNWFPMRGLGQGSRNNLEDFERQGFIEGTGGDRVDFEYNGIHDPLVETVTTGDVVWAAALLSRLSDAQWRDAFRAAGYSDEEISRFVAKLKSKVAEGLALAS